MLRKRLGKAGFVVGLAVGVPAALVCALLLYVSVVNSRVEPAKNDPAASLVFRAPNEHPVTTAMLQAAKELGKNPAPPFGAVDSSGRWYTLDALTKGKPLVMFFVELQCPCCKGAKDYIDRIHEYYGDVCNVVGVINADPETTKAWENAVIPHFPILCDPEMRIIRGYKAERGVYTTLVAPGGRIVEAYPGYSQSMLASMAKHIETLTGIAKRPMPLAPAPKTLTSGCLFPGVKVPVDQL